MVNGALYPKMFRLFHNLGEPLERKMTPDEKDMIKANFYLLLFGRDNDIKRISAFKDALAKAKFKFDYVTLKTEGLSKELENTPPERLQIVRLE